MSTITEHVERRAATGSTRTCEAIWEFLGIEAPCGEPAIGLFRRACAHEHVRDGLAVHRTFRDPAERILPDLLGTAGRGVARVPDRYR